MKTIMLTVAAGLVALGAGGAVADTADKRVALSNNYAGNSWRQAMLRSWDEVTGQAVSNGVVAAADPFTTAENQVTLALEACSQNLEAEKRETTAREPPETSAPMTVTQRPLM